jgi:hypothetical protein
LNTPRRPGQTKSNHILSVVSDDHNVICHTEATLDTWWHSLAPEDKAALYELHLDGALDPKELPRLRATISGETLEEIILRGDQALGLMRAIAMSPVTLSN